MSSYELNDCLVVGVASSALFDLGESDKVFRAEGEEAYRAYQEANLQNTLQPGVAFSFIQRLLSLNDLRDQDRPLVEVIVLSRNDPETGLRVMQSIEDYKLGISRAIFTQGQAPYKYMQALNMSLFLSANGDDVRDALADDPKNAAGQVIGDASSFDLSSDDQNLRIAFDFDGVLAGDSSERIMIEKGLEAFHSFEHSKAGIPMEKGRLARLLKCLNQIQNLEDSKLKIDPNYHRRLRISIVTARDAPAHERVVKTIQSWGLRVNDAFFLGGIDKSSILRVLKPHIFFDDQLKHVEGASKLVPSVHIPFGVQNT